MRTKFDIYVFITMSASIQTTLLQEYSFSKGA